MTATNRCPHRGVGHAHRTQHHAELDSGMLIGGRSPSKARPSRTRETKTGATDSLGLRCKLSNLRNLWSPFDPRTIACRLNRARLRPVSAHRCQPLDAGRVVYRNLIQTGVGTVTVDPVGVRRPDVASIRKLVITSERWFAARRNWPLGSSAKLRGARPPLDTCST